jgi:glutathione peroxidase-family protein
MKPFFIIVFILSFMLSFSQDFKDHQWKNRVLIVSTNNEKDIDFQKQINLLENLDEELKERKLIVYQIVGDKYKLGFTESYKLLNSSSKKYVSTKDGLQVLLIGLDGGIKLKQSSILTAEKLFAIIDGMPMRKRELRKNR